MKCRSCSHEFCWVCTGKWSEHGSASGGFYKCNKYDPKAAAAAAKAAGGGGSGAAGAASKEETSKLELNRYLHYYSRYHNHDRAKKFADKQRTAAELRMTQLQAKQTDSISTAGGSSWMDVQFIRSAVDQIIECRRVLKYTYVLAYYVPNGSAEHQLLEFLQQQLEHNTEQLSEYSESASIDTLISSGQSTAITNLTRITKNVRSHMPYTRCGVCASDCRTNPIVL